MDAEKRSEAARVLRSFYRRVPGVCLECTSQFEGAKGRRYCSDACKIKAFRRRQKESANAHP